YVTPELGRVTLNQLTAAHLRRLYAKLRERGLAVATVSLIHTVIHRALRDARRDGLVGKNVAEDTAPASPRRDASGRAFTPDQLRILDQAIVGHQHEQLWRVLLLTGLRIGEAAALRWSDVDLDSGRLHVHRSYRRTLAGPVLSAPKTARGRRTIPLGAAGLRALRAQRQTAPPWTSDALVFPNRLGAPLRADKVLAEFKEVLAAAGLPKRRLHDLRHTFATGLFARGVSHRAAQELLGHARLEMTMDLYTGSVPEVLDDAIARMDNLFTATLG
ncbi:MAG TPA: site-specific integrase, partial [Chloroflexota bacterium]|nr:site-specific integrase [Chloroflexota bacterium]